MTEKQLRELDAWIAEYIFGWEWLARANQEPNGTVIRRALFSNDPDWVRFNFVAAEWGKADGTESLFSDWDRCCAERDDEHQNKNRKWGLPHYTTDPAAAMAVLEKCMEHPWMQGQMPRITKTGRVFTWDNAKKREPLHSADTLYLAIALFSKQLHSK